MKILFFSRLYYPHVGGVEKHVYKLSKELTKSGYEITILTTNYNNRLPSSEETDSIKIIRFKQPNIRYLGLLYTWYWLIKNIGILREYDIIHIHDVFIWYLPIKLLIPQKRVFMTFHGQWGQYPIRLIDRIQKKIAEKLSNGNICIGKYISVNYHIKADAISYGAVELPVNRVKKIKNKILYVGRLDKELTLSKLFKMLDKLKNYTIDFVGGGEMEELCSNYGKVYGFTDPNPFYDRSKYVYASGYLTILEALAYKCLVFVSYKTPLQRDYYQLSPFKDFIVCDENPVKLVSKFNELANNSKKADKLITDGYNWVKGQTWEKIMSNYIALWKTN
jgi:glycosyltransferase involved in cell wall biosynthesis